MSVRLLHTLAFAWVVGLSGTATAAPLNIAEAPLFLNGTVAPLNLLVIGRDHKLYYEAYNDASDLNADGVLDTRYKGYELKVPAPAAGSTDSRYKIDYFGYFDSYKCYEYSTDKFVPVSATTGAKTCSGYWSGDYLNYLTTSRIDALRKVLYGGDRRVDDVGETILERSYIPQDAHSWGKEYDPAVDGFNITDYTPLAQPAANTRHFFANTTPRGGDPSGSTLYDGSHPPLLRYLQNMPSTVRIWNWLSRERPVAHRATDAVNNITLANSDFTDLIVRVKVCATTPAGLLEANCKLYNNGTSYKPTGIIQDYGEGAVPRMYFGLITGSYAKNTSGGVLRAPMGSGTSPLAAEISATTGQFLNQDNVSGPAIIKTLNRMHPTGFGTNFEYDCGWDYSQGSLPNGRCQMWGNPIAEIMYEGMRYLGGKASANSQFATNFGDGNESQLPYGGLPVVNTWTNPYASQPQCAKPFQTVISDINPSHDSDRLPGSNWPTTLQHGNDLPGSMSVTTLGNTIWNNEFGAGNRNIFIGESSANTPAVNYAPTAKTVNSFGNIRGLAPEEPTRQGSYYSASVAYHGHKTDINTTEPGVQEVTTFAIGLASPLPKIEIPINGNLVTLVPFAKSPGGSVGHSNGTDTITFSPDLGSYQPTNQIVDFYVDTLTPTTGRFRVNFEDVEFGADHDMDAIVVYEYAVTGSSVAVTLTSEYAAGSIKQHMGYIISGTTADGIYMEVRDQPASATDVDFFLDTPPGVGPGTALWADGVDLPFITTRTFSAGSTPGADLLKNPLWYAAKWGGYQETDNDDIPEGTEWDEDGNGDPDNYFLVTNALHLGAQLSAAFEELLERVGSASAASVNAGSISSETRVYQAKFNSGDWSGQVLSFPVNPDGTLQAAEWDAGQLIPAANSRVIITRTSAGAAVPFRWADIGAARQSELQPAPDTLGSDRLDWLRGDSAREFPAGPFRDRDTNLGDIVSSSPTFVGAPAFFYRDTLEAQPYSAFVTAQATRQKMVYAGANDGMLHGFNATTGREMLAFIPSAVFPNLHSLTSRTYSHKFYVDGTPTFGDVFYNGGWHTVLVGGLNRGGRSIYALDITDPSGFNEANAANIFRWEYTDTELGYTYSRPAIVRMRNGRWAAVFGNGYNNTGTGRAYLYIVDIETGVAISKIDTGVGDTTTPNGLATPALVDLNGDRIIDYAYAGDLRGNMWKFNLTSTTSAGWVIDYDNGSGVPRPIFTATDGAATPTPQPITSRPEVGRGPRGAGMVVLFGTGKFLEPGDKNPGPKQTFYGLYDPNTGGNSDIITSRSLMTAQNILAEGTVSGKRVRLTSQNAVPTTSRGWYLDLLRPPVPGTLQGEMQVSNSILRNGRVIFTTLIPDPDVCSSGGTSWLMELDSLTGARLAITPFDVNGDNQFNNDDIVTITLADGTVITGYVSGVGSEVGIAETPGVLATAPPAGGGSGQEFKYLSGSATSPSGSNLQRLVENPGPNSTGRQSWRQVK